MKFETNIIARRTFLELNQDTPLYLTSISTLPRHGHTICPCSHRSEGSGPPFSTNSERSTSIREVVSGREQAYHTIGLGVPWGSEACSFPHKFCLTYFHPFYVHSFTNTRIRELSCVGRTAEGRVFHRRFWSLGFASGPHWLVWTLAEAKMLPLRGPIVAVITMHEDCGWRLG
jgi:hypothetical protein